MFTTKMNDFCKNEDCPASQELLEFANGDLTVERGSEINFHLHSCEFCSAEVEFYICYPQADVPAEPVEPAEIPAPLFELAEALLKHRHDGNASLDSLLEEKGTFVLDNA